MTRTMTTSRLAGAVCGLAMMMLGLAAGPALGGATNWYVSVTNGSDSVLFRDELGATLSDDLQRH